MRDILLTTLLFALIPVSIVQPWLGILTWYWIGLMNPHRLTWGFAYDFPFAMLIGLAVLIGTLFAKDRKPIPWNRELVLVVILAAYFTFTTLFAWAPEYAWPEWLKVIKIILMTFVCTMLIHGRERLRWLLLVIVVSIGFYGFKGGIFTILTGGGYRVEGPIGTFIAGNTYLGMALCMVLPLIMSVARDVEQTWLRRLLYATFGLTVVSIIFTYSRGALLGLAAVLPLMYFKSKRKFLLVFLIIPIALVGKDLLPGKLTRHAETIETYEQDTSAMQRIQSWTVAWNLAKDYPLTGAGFEFEYSPNTERWFSYGNPEYNKYLRDSSAAHSIYFQVLGQHGYIALALFLMLLIFTQFTFSDIALRAEQQESTRWMARHATAMRVGLIGYMVSGAFINVAYFDLMYLYIGFAALFSRELATVTTMTPDPAADAVARQQRLHAFDMLKPKEG